METMSRATYTESDIDVLYVEDNKGLRDLVPEILERENESLNFDTAANPIEAMEHMEGHEYQVVLSDYEMPEMNGLEFLEEIKNNHEGPFILYTGSREKDLGLKAIETGVSDYFWKDQEVEHYTHMAEAIQRYAEEI